MARYCGRRLAAAAAVAAAVAATAAAASASPGAWDACGLDHVSIVADTAGYGGMDPDACESLAHRIDAYNARCGGPEVEQLDCGW